MKHLQKNPRIIQIVMIALLLLFAAPHFGYSQTCRNNFSRWEHKRPKRARTLYIVLHTTEGRNSSSLGCVKKSGTCNYLVETDGTIDKIISDNKIAKHAGRSMWYGHSNLSNLTIGIEVVGFHNQEPTEKQCQALKYLLQTLKKKYGLKDANIVTHSMVAYGKPNRWVHFSNRGRKRCGMLFATARIRKKLGLSNTFSSDPDVIARRLKNADPYLAQVLYCGKKMTKACTVPADPKPIKGVTEDEEDEDDESFEGFDIVSKKETPYSIAEDEYRSASTIYFFADGKIRKGSELSKKELNSIPVGTKMLTGYIYGGRITKGRSAFSMAKGKWDEPSTFYVLPDHTVKTGDDMDEDNLPLGAIVLFRK